MTIPAEKARLLDAVAAALSNVKNVKAVALGGSHARNTHGPGSDLDVAIYYREATPFRVAEIDAVAKRFSAGGSPTVTDFYEWGPFVNGGAWIDNAICKVDFLYRNLDQLERIVAAAQRGEWDHNFDQQPPFGFRTVTILGEIHIGKSLYDPDNLLGPLKAAVVSYPPKLKERVAQSSLWASQFSLLFARNFVKAGDVPNTVGCMTRIYHYLVHVLFALNETYLVNDKTALKEIGGFKTKPEDFGTRFSAVLAAPGGSPELLGASLDLVEALIAETIALAGAYKPRFVLG
jgi:hypothetical protein